MFEVRGPDGRMRSSLDDVTGYVAELIRIVERHLNFSSSLTFTNHFGSQLQNGSWIGMIGFLARGVSLYFLATVYCLAWTEIEPKLKMD